MSRLCINSVLVFIFATRVTYRQAGTGGLEGGRKKSKERRGERKKGRK